MEQLLQNSLEINLRCLKHMFSESVDLYSKEFIVKGRRCFVCMFEGLSSLTCLPVEISAAIDRQQKNLSAEELYDFLKYKTDLPVENVIIETFEQVRQYLTAGASVVFVDGCNKALAFSTQNMQYRSVQEPSGEGNIRGPREGFSEILRVNISLVRRIVRTESLVAETFTLGSRTKTEVALLYDHNLSDERTINRLKQKLKNIKIPVLFDASYLAPFLHRGTFSFFNDVGYTERPAVAAAKICEGKAIVMVSGNPFVMIIPYFFSENFESLDDYSNKAYFTSFIRILRYMAFFISVLLPGIFVAFAEYTPQAFPAEFLFKFAQAEAEVPVPLSAEMIIVIILLEMIREAGLRLPKAIGHTVGLVAALIVGDTAVKAGLLSVPVVITAAVTTISMLATPFLYEASTVLRILYVLAGAVFGPLGISALFFVMTISICSMNSFGMPYTAPFVPYNSGTLRDGLVRLSWKRLSKRPFTIKDFLKMKGKKTDRKGR